MRGEERYQNKVKRDSYIQDERGGEIGTRIRGREICTRSYWMRGGEMQDERRGDTG
jgi:hypothetical protein